MTNHMRLPLMEPISSLSDVEFLAIYGNHWMRYTDSKRRLWMVTRQHYEATVKPQPVAITVVELSTEQEQRIELPEFRNLIEQKLFIRLEKPLQIAFTIL
ncbi:MAG: hypothetical protein Q8J69_07660 [Sphingobacteriaceae bacterium]|nr:hypothetical protein [Sphingobacteriaceae bacterium]